MGGFYHEGDNDSSPEIKICSGMDRGLAYAEACFETFRVIDGNIFSWTEHMARLRYGLAEFGLTLSDSMIAEMRSNCLAAAVEHGNDALVRITVSGGESGWGLLNKGRPAIRVQALAGVRSTPPLALRLKQWPFPPRMRPAKFVADYSDTLRALRGDPDADVLFAQGDRLLGSATANLLLYRQAQWWTPKMSAGILPGIVRGHLLAGGILREADCLSDWLPHCQAVAVSNSGFFIRPVVSISGYKSGLLEFDVKHAAFHPLVESFAGMDGVPGELLK